MKLKLQIIVVLLIIISGFIFYHSKKDTYNLTKELEGIEGQNTDSKPSVLSYFFPFLKSDLQRKIDKGESVNFLMLGYGGEGHSGAYLTDTMIIGKMNFGTGEATLMNIPRDLWVNGQKINSVYAVTNRNTESVIDVIENTFGIPIDYFLTVDFDGFRQAVDEMGGLEIYVDNTFDDYNYPRNDNDQIDAGVMHIHFDEGWEMMNGEKALQYARSRYSTEDGGDFNRSMRQQKVLQAFKEKVLETKDIRTLFNVVKIISGHFTTNFPYAESITIYQYLNSYEVKIKNKIISEENYLYFTYNEEGSYILLPIDDDFSAIKNYFESSD